MMSPDPRREAPHTPSIASEHYPRTLDCVHCGLCLGSCPTYSVTGRESDGPRGRIHLLRGLAESRIERTPAVEKHLLECIVCRACESACPSGVRMGEMMESFRADLARESRGGVGDLVKRFLLRHVLPHRERIAFLTNLLHAYQRTGLTRVSKAVTRRFFPRLHAMQELLPPLPPASERRIATDRTRPQGYPAEGPPRMRVGLFLGCIASQWFARTHEATIRVLCRNGIEVVIPHEQTCCGALHRHCGLAEDSTRLFQRNAEVFSSAGVDAVVVNAAGCGLALKERPPGLTGDLGVPVRDVCELLDEVGIVPPAGGTEVVAAYHQPCHLVHGQGIGPEPVIRLLGRIPGLQWVPLRDSDRCCGSGGIYNILNPDLARAVLEEKLVAILESGARVVVTGNPGCLLQIRARLAQVGVEILHPVDLLDRAYDVPRDDSRASERPQGAR